MIEHFDEAEVLNEKALQLVQFIRKAKHFVVFTGAGISTSAGIPDFRGPEGVWTLRDQGKTRKSPSVNTINAIPTFTHRAILELQKRGIVKYLISQNTDGLHRRSGFPSDFLSELHGNTNKETCLTCKKEYLRDFKTRVAQSTTAHLTGRKCYVCDGNLADTIINFGENLPEKPMNLAFVNAKKSDLHLVLGSSLTVSPANQMPEDTVSNGGKLVICNLQKTPHDKLAHLRIYAKTDDLMKLVMEKLEITVPPFILTRRYTITRNKKNIKIAGIDADYTPMTFIYNLDVNQSDTELESFSSKELIEIFQSKNIDYTGCVEKRDLINSIIKNGIYYKTYDMSKEIIQNFILPNTPTLKIRIHFMGHYNEPHLDIEHQFDEDKYDSETMLCTLNFNPLTGVWVVDPVIRTNSALKPIVQI